MADTRFYNIREPMTLAAICKLTEARLADPGKAEYVIAGVASLDTASDRDISFLTDRKHLDGFKSSGAGACFLADDSLAENAPQTMTLLFVSNPQKAYAAVASLLYQTKTGFDGIAKSAFVSPSAKIGEGVRIGPGAVLLDEVEVGADTVIGPNSVLGPGVKLGTHSSIGANVTVDCALIGDRVAIHNGTQIGQDGFGYASESDGHTKIPQLGRVIIQDDVEVGANSTIDRGAVGDTIIGEGTKIDNLVHVAHNCTIGRNCILVTMVGISGSCTIGDGVVLAGKVGVADHVTIGDGAMVAARAGVISDLAAGGKYGGFPAKPIADWRREAVLLARLVKERRPSK